MKGLKVLEISVLRFLYFLLKVRYNTSIGYKQLPLIVWNTECVVIFRCTKSVLFNKYVLLCRYRLIKKGCSVSLHNTPKAKKYSLLLQNRYKETNNPSYSYAEAYLSCTGEDGCLCLLAPDHVKMDAEAYLSCTGEDGCLCLLIRFYSVYLSSYCQKALI